MVPLETMNEAPSSVRNVFPKLRNCSPQIQKTVLFFQLLFLTACVLIASGLQLWYCLNITVPFLYISRSKQCFFYPIDFFCKQRFVFWQACRKFLAKNINRNNKVLFFKGSLFHRIFHLDTQKDVSTTTTKLFSKTLVNVLCKVWKACQN